MTKYTKFLNLILLFLLFLLSGCSTSYLRHVGRETWIAKMAESALVSGDLSYKTRHFLVTNALMEEFDNDPEKIIKLLAKHVEHPEMKVIPDMGKTREALGALLELCMYQAQNTSDDDEAIKYWTSCCFYSYRFLFDKSVKPPGLPYDALGMVASVRYYNMALSEVLAYMLENKISLQFNNELPMVVGKIKLNELHSDLMWKPGSFKEYVLCFDFMPKNLLSHSYASGLGVPVIAVKDPEADPAKDKEITFLKRSYPFTFLLKFESFNVKEQPVKAQPEFFDSFHNEFTNIDGHKIPLAKDYSIMMGTFLRGKNYISGIWYMFFSDEMGDRQGLYFITPYNPDKIPVVLVHGLMSDPRTWIQMLNTLFGNRTIRENYQFWLYAYPTGQPVIYSAYQFRKALTDVHRKYNPDNKNTKFNDMVLVSHSMGGIISRLAIQSSQGEGLVKKLLKNRLDKINLTEEQKQFAMDVLVFEALPFIKRVLFLATPHKGSEMATWSISRFGSRLISLPSRITNKGHAIMKQAAIASGLTDDDDPLNLAEIATGIDNLEPEHPMVQATANLPICNNVKRHSIIGDNEKAGHKDGTDGIVPYWSSHREDVESEIVVKSGHSVQQHTSCIKEVTRILMEHLRKDLEK